MTCREALGTVEFNPHLSPLDTGAQPHDTLDTPISYSTSTLRSAPAAPAAAPAAQLVDTGVDTDGDTLSDFSEERIGTSAVISDTDGDGLNDGVEVHGFAFGGQTWYTDPLAS